VTLRVLYCSLPYIKHPVSNVIIFIARPHSFRNDNNSVRPSVWNTPVLCQNG